MAKKRVGMVTHYFPKAGAAVVDLQDGPLHVGDRIRIRGHSDDVELQVDSLQIEHEAVEEAPKGEEVGLGVPEKVHENSDVFIVED